MPAFLFPLFLVALASLAIPLTIHLFNLRRYKVVQFPHTRFLRDIALTSRRQRQVRHRVLLALRMLLLLFLVLAFAQPFFRNRGGAGQANALHVIYVDNSQSMTAKRGARTLLEAAREAAATQVRTAAPGQRFLILTNDRPLSYAPVRADVALTQVQSIAEGLAPRTNVQLYATIQSLVQADGQPGADLYWYSDFQRNAFVASPPAEGLKGLRVHYIPVQSEATGNVFIDTAWINAPVLQVGQPNQLIVRSRVAGDPPKNAPVLQVSIGGQVKSAATLAFADNAVERTDTLAFSVSTPGWQRLAVHLNDANVRFDDTFFIAARSAPALSVLVLDEGAPNPFIQAAFRAYQGFQVTSGRADAPPADFSLYNLIILNGATRLDAPLAAQLSKALAAGQSVLVFPARTAGYPALSAGLHQLADIRITALDTARQAATTLQQGSDLVRDIFDRVPENVQLPEATWHYTIQAGLSANPQSVLSFRNGDPMLLKMQPSRGRLYLAAMSADLEGGSFPGSYFFVPFLYQMAVQSRGTDVYAITAGSGQPAFLPLAEAGERNMVHARGPGLTDVIPPQRPAGGGLEVFLDQTATTPGFYQLAAAGTDSAVAGFNASRQESDLAVWDMAALRKAYTGPEAEWAAGDQKAKSTPGNGFGELPLWKICAAIALVLVLAETWVLLGGRRRDTPATPLGNA